MGDFNYSPIISSLLVQRYPGAIFWFIVSVVVNPFNRKTSDVSRRHGPIVKYLEVIPWREEYYSPAPIIFKTSVLRISASLFYLCPYMIKRKDFSVLKFVKAMP